jgi:hypothetical protein
VRLSGFESTVEPLSSTVIYRVAHMSRFPNFPSRSLRRFPTSTDMKKGLSLTCTGNTLGIHLGIHSRVLGIQHSRVFPCIPVYSRVFPCIPVYSRVGWGEYIGNWIRENGPISRISSHMIQIVQHRLGPCRVVKITIDALPVHWWCV